MCKQLFILYALFLIIPSCNRRTETQPTRSSVTLAGINPLLSAGTDPWATYTDGTYYYTQSGENRISLWKTTDITDLKNAEKKVIWLPQDDNHAHHLWAPEIHYLNHKWYVYFSADNGNTDNHQIYVIENSSPDPLQGKFVLKGRIATDADNNWAIHANVFEHAGELYMTWSGWQSRRIETEYQCIYIARMENPWTLKSDRVLLSKPEWEWERQWISPDGSKTAYPIYVNEAPQFFRSKNKDKLFIFYSASGRWTPYYALGMLTADAKSNLLDPASWVKSSEPVFKQNADNKVYAPGNICFVPSPDGKETWFIYHAREIPNDSPGALDSRSPRIQKLEEDAEGTPVLGVPVAINP